MTFVTDGVRRRSQDESCKASLLPFLKSVSSLWSKDHWLNCELINILVEN